MHCLPISGDFEVTGPIANDEAACIILSDPDLREINDSL
jgi:hypothetical protein